MTKEELRNFIFDTYEKSAEKNYDEFLKSADEIEKNTDDAIEAHAKISRLREDYINNNIFDAITETIIKLFPNTIDS